MTVEYTHNSTEALLKIANVELEDEASYKCEITYLEVRENCDVVQIIRLQTLVKPEPARIFSTTEDPSLQRSIANTTYGPHDEGTGIELVCESNGGKPEPVVTWYNGTQRMNFPSKSLEVEGLFRSSSTLHIRLSRGDLGARFKCEISSDALDEPMVSWITMDVHVKPRTMTLQYQEQVVQGSTVLLICDIFGANPPADVKWYNNSNLITNESLIHTVPEAMRDDGTYTTKSELEFKATRWDDGRNFRCYAENSVTKRQTDTSFYRQFTLQVKYPPVVTVSPENVTITESKSSSILLKCWASANPMTLKQVFWMRDGRNITLSQEKYLGGNAAHPFLTINNVSREDMGEYTCTCMNEVGASDSENSAFVNVLFPPDVEVHLEPENSVKSLDGVNVTAMCLVAAGNPLELLKVRWSLGEELLKELPECNYTSNETNSTGGLYCNVDPSVLSLVTVDQSFAGNYTCQGMNSVGWGAPSEPTELIVFYPPTSAKLTYVPKKVVKKGQVELICSVDHPGRPENLSYIWYRGKHKLSGQTTAKLTINPVKLDTRNNFTCMASNEGGSGEASTVFINVSAPPTFITPLKYPVVIADQPEMSLTCRVECSPLCFISWFKGNEQIDTRNSKLYDIKTTIRDANAKTGDFESIESTLIWNVDAWPTHPFAKTSAPANYMCISSSNGVGGGVNASVVVEVQYAPEHLVLSSNIISIVEGQIPPQVVCGGKGFPDIHYTWQKNTSSESKEVSQTAVLNLPSVTRNDTGSYICKASNSRGDAEIGMSLIVEYAPECNITRTKYNSKPALLCMVNAVPEEVSFSWRIPPTNETNDEHLSGAVQEGTKSYLILDSNIPSFRTYQCNASNSAGFGRPCEIDVAGVASATDSWWPALSDNTLIIVAVIAGIILCAIFVCIIIIIIICVCRRRRARNKYNNSVELEEREKPNFATEVSSFTYSKWPLKPGVLVHVNSMKSLLNQRQMKVATPPAVRYKRSKSKVCAGLERLRGLLGFGDREAVPTGIYSSPSGVTFKRFITPPSVVPEPLPLSRKRKKPGFVPNQSSTADRIRPGGFSKDGSTDPLTHPADRGFYENLPFHGMQTPPNKPVSIIAPFVLAKPSSASAKPLLNPTSPKQNQSPTLPTEKQTPALPVKRCQSFTEDEKRFNSLLLQKTHRCYSPTFYSVRCKKHGKKRPVMYAIPKYTLESPGKNKEIFVLNGEDGTEPPRPIVILDSLDDKKSATPKPAPRCKRHKRNSSCHVYENISFRDTSNNSGCLEISVTEAIVHAIKPPVVQSVTPKKLVVTDGPLKTFPVKQSKTEGNPKPIQTCPVPCMPLMDQNRWAKLANTANQMAFYTLTTPHYKHPPDPALVQHNYSATIPHQKAHTKLIPRALFQEQQLSKSKSFSARTKPKKQHFQIPLQKCSSFKFQTAESYFQPIKNVHEENYMRNGFVSDSRNPRRHKDKNKGPLVLRRSEQSDLPYPQPVYGRRPPNGLVYADLDMPNKAKDSHNSSDSPKVNQTKPKTEYATLNFNEVGKEIDV